MMLQIFNPGADSIGPSSEIPMMGSSGVRDLHSKHEDQPKIGTNGIIGQVSVPFN